MLLLAHRQMIVSLLSEYGNVLKYNNNSNDDDDDDNNNNK